VSGSALVAKMRTSSFVKKIVNLNKLEELFPSSAILEEGTK